MQTGAKVNNEIYEIYGDTWWNEDAEFGLSSLRYCVNPVRYGYFKRILQRLRIPGKTVLDVGCGGGFLAEEFARDGFQVTGIDPSAKSVASARKHAAENRLDIRYEVGQGEAMQFPDGSFDLVACCDVLEHVDDLEKVIGEVSRLLKPGGSVFLRHRQSDLAEQNSPDQDLAGLVVHQVLHELTSHVWEKFIKPAELTAIMQTCNLVHQEMKGIAPRKQERSYAPAASAGDKDRQNAQRRDGGRAETFRNR